MKRATTLYPLSYRFATLLIKTHLLIIIYKISTVQKSYFDPKIWLSLKFPWIVITTSIIEYIWCTARRQLEGDSIASGICVSSSKSVISEDMLWIISCALLLKLRSVNATEHLWWQVNLGSGNCAIRQQANTWANFEPDLSWYGS